jgi:glycerol uptake facilitator-like aquaporin
MNHSLLTPFFIVTVLGLVLLLLALVFDCIKPCRTYAPLCRFLCLGIILGCVAGLAGEFAYDFVERWLFQNVPSRSIMNFVDAIFDHGYPRILGSLAGAAAAVWFWHASRLKFEQLQKWMDSGRTHYFD